MKRIVLFLLIFVQLSPQKLNATTYDISPITNWMSDNKLESVFRLSGLALSVWGAIEAIYATKKLQQVPHRSSSQDDNNVRHNLKEKRDFGLLKILLGLCICTVRGEF